MNEWFYTKNGDQLGPVSESELMALLAGGTLDAHTSLVWKSGMGDWVPAAQIAELATAPAASSDPYAAPASGLGPNVAPDATIPLPEIEPGSESIDAMACFKRGFDLTVRNIGDVLLMIVAYIAITIALNVGLTILDSLMGWEGPSIDVPVEGGDPIKVPLAGSAINEGMSIVLGVFLSLGFARFILNLVSGRQVSVGQLFGEARLVFRALIAMLFFGFMVGIGFVLLIVPGIYLISRFGFFMTAIVDRNCGIIESFRYSSRITTNNRGSMVLIMLISFGVMVLGALALLIGILFALPVVSLAWTVAFRWLQYGYRAAMDHPGTTTPMLTPTYR